MKKVKNVLLKMEFSGRGIVNFDGDDMKHRIGQHYYENGGANKSSYKNVTYAKSVFFKDLNGNIDRKIKVSSNCLRAAIFHDCAKPGMCFNEDILYTYLASPVNLARGCTFTGKKVTFKRKSVLNIEDAIQNNGAMPTLDTCTRSGEKVSQTTDVDKNTGDKDTTYFLKESVGDITYQSNGQINLMDLQFISLDNSKDRMAFNPEKQDIFKKYFDSIMPTPIEPGNYYNIIGSFDRIPEFGILISNENIVFLVKEMLKNIKTLNIYRSGGSFRCVKLQYKLVYDLFEDTRDSDDNWVTINNINDIETLSFNHEIFYEINELGENIVDMIEENKDLINREKVIEKSKKSSKK